jgi:hypothetical protein
MEKLNYFLNYENDLDSISKNQKKILIFSQKKLIDFIYILNLIKISRVILFFLNLQKIENIDFILNIFF